MKVRLVDKVWNLIVVYNFGEKDGKYLWKIKVFIGRFEGFYIGCFFFFGF